MNFLSRSSLQNCVANWNEHLMYSFIAWYVHKWSKPFYVLCDTGLLAIQQPRSQSLHKMKNGKWEQLRTECYVDLFRHRFWKYKTISVLSSICFFLPLTSVTFSGISANSRTADWPLKFLVTHTIDEYTSKIRRLLLIELIPHSTHIDRLSAP